MSRAEDLLNVVSEEIPVHAHPVPDTDTYFIIDPITRKIENTSRKKTVVMQYDHNSERFTFELPRYIDGHDMLECTSVTVNVDNIEVIEPGEGEEVVEPRINSDAPDMTDLRTHPNDPEKVVTSWLISRNSTQLAGILSFSIEFKCVDSNSNVVYEWSTDNFDEIEVKARKKNGEAAVMPYTDVLEQWRTSIFGAGDSVMANIAAEGKTQVDAVKMESETQQEAVELKGAQTLETIPEDYTETNNMANEAVRTKADAIVCEVAGKSIVLKDSSNDHIRGLKLFGKSSQDGTPTLDNPVEIVSVKNPLVSIYGDNLLEEPDIGRTWTVNGLTCTYEGDGIYHFAGTYERTSADASFATMYMDVPADLNTHYTLSVKLIDGTPPETFRSFVGLASNTKAHQNWFSVMVGPSTKVGSIVSETKIPRSYLADAKKVSRFWIYLHNDVQEAFTADFRIQVWFNRDSVSMEYSPYIEQNIETAHTLTGIPVTSGGNYTDENGQQWICDEIDLERGVRIQRIKNFVLSELNPDTWYTWGVSKNTEGVTGFYHYFTDSVILDFVLSNIGVYGHQTWGGLKPGVGASANSKYVTLSLNNECLADTSSDEKAIDSLKTLLANTKATMLAAIEPIETPLTAEEITAFKALRTNYPNTTILNDAGAWMSVKYNADTKSYIENPKTLKLVDSSTGVVYELKIVDGNLVVNPV